MREKSLAYNRNFLEKYQFKTNQVSLIYSNESAIEKYVISIAIPSYQRTNLLIRLLKSIEELRTSLAFEVVITEDTREEEHIVIIREFLQKCNFKVRYFKNNKRLGLYPNWNQAISLTKGTYFCLVHSDDVLHPLFLKAYEKDIGKEKVLGQKWTYLYVKENPNNLKDFLCSSQKEKPSKSLNVYSFLRGQLVCPLLGTLFLKEVLDVVGFFPCNEKFTNYEDLVFMIKVSLYYNILQVQFNGYGYVIEDNYMLISNEWTESITGLFYLRKQVLQKLNKFSLLAKAKCYSKIIFEIHDRNKWNKNYCSSKESKAKVNKKEIYRSVKMPFVFIILKPLLFLIHYFWLLIKKVNEKVK